MAEETAPSADAPKKSVFLSYASEDRAAAEALRDALAALDLVPWYDAAHLDGGDAWDQKIRRQIRECDFFMPVISARTDARTEGYFRREWRLAVERAFDMADDRIFLLPVVIDDTDEAAARVPDRFRAVQWTHVPDGRPTAAFEALCRRLAAGETSDAPAPRSAERRSRRGTVERARPAPEFPRHEPGQTARFYGQVVVWGVQSLRFLIDRLPRWVRFLVYAWLVILILRACGSN